MLFQDLSCVAKNTLERGKSTGFYDILELDWLGLVSLGKNSKVKIDGTLDFTGIGDDFGLKFIEEKKAELLLEDSNFNIFEYENYYFAKLLIRKTERYEVFYLFCRKNTIFKAKELKWSQLYIEKSYDLVLANNELIQSNNYISNVFDSTDSLILVFDSYLNIVTNNKALSDLNDSYEQDDKLTLSTLNLENEKEFEDSLNDVLSNNKKVSLGSVDILKENQTRKYSFSLSPFKNSKNEVVVVVAVGSDITKLQMINHEIEQLSNYGLMGQIALGLSHNEKNHQFFVVMSLVIINMILTLGGVSLFVVVFTVVEIAKELFEEFNVPWKMYTCGVLGSSSFTSTMIPGNPSIINIIPTNYLGTNTMAAPLLGMICAVITFILGSLYIFLETKKNTKNNEGFFPTGKKIKEANIEKVTFNEQPLLKCLIPSIMLIVVLNVFNASPVIALTVACFVKMVLFYKELFPNLPEVFKMGGENATSAIVSICAAVGFGSVVASVPGYQLVINSLDSIPGPAILQLVLSFNVISAVTGSSSGGASIAFSTLGNHFTDLGLSPQVIHRVGIMSSNGLDSLPHSGAIFNTLNITRLTHKQAYKNYFMLTVVLETGMSLFAGILTLIGIV